MWHFAAFLLLEKYVFVLGAERSVNIFLSQDEKYKFKIHISLRI